MIDRTGIAIVAAALLIWWYAPIYLSRLNAEAAKNEINLNKKLYLLDWAIFFHRTSENILDYADTLFRIAQVDENPHARLIQTQQSCRIVEGLLLTTPSYDIALSARALLDEIKSDEPTAKRLADISAESAGRMKVVE